MAENLAELSLWEHIFKQLSNVDPEALIWAGEKYTEGWLVGGSLQQCPPLGSRPPNGPARDKE